MFWVTGLIGLALAVAPWILNYADNTNAMWVSVIAGVAVVLVSAYKGFMHDTDQKWEYWVAGLGGIVAAVAPFVLQFTALTAALWTGVVLGVLLIAVSGYELFFVNPETPAAG